MARCMSLIRSSLSRARPEVEKMATRGSLEEDGRELGQLINLESTPPVSPIDSGQHVRMDSKDFFEDIKKKYKGSLSKATSGKRQFSDIMVIGFNLISVEFEFYR